MARQQVDYELGSAETGDSGERESAAINPIVDGNPATSANFQRPSENLRLRSEVVRDRLEELLFKSDADMRWIINGGDSAGNPSPNIPQVGNWDSVAGTFEISGACNVQPLNTPPAATTATHQFTFGTPFTATFSADAAGGKRSYNGANLIRIKWLAVPAAELAGALVDGYCDITLTGSPLHIVTIRVRDDNTTTKANVDAALGIIGGDLNTAGIEYATGGSASDTIDVSTSPDYLVDSIDYMLDNAAERELHYFTAANFNAFVAANPLVDGDTLGIWFNYYLTDDPVTDGRRQSIVENSNTEIDLSGSAGKFFLASANPEYIPNCIPLCKRIGDYLYWLDGTVVTPYQSDKFIAFGEHGRTQERLGVDIWETDAVITGEWRHNAPVSIYMPLSANPWEALSVSSNAGAITEASNKMAQFWGTLTTNTVADSDVDIVRVQTAMNTVAATNSDYGAVRNTYSYLTLYQGHADEIIGSDTDIRVATASPVTVDEVFCASRSVLRVESLVGGDLDLPAISAATYATLYISNNTGDGSVVTGDAKTAYFKTDLTGTAAFDGSVYGVYTDVSVNKTVAGSSDKIVGHFIDIGVGSSGGFGGLYTNNKIFGIETRTNVSSNCSAGGFTAAYLDANVLSANDITTLTGVEQDVVTDTSLWTYGFNTRMDVRNTNGTNRVVGSYLELTTVSNFDGTYIAGDAHSITAEGTYNDYVSGYRSIASFDASIVLPVSHGLYVNHTFSDDVVADSYGVYVLLDQTASSSSAPVRDTYYSAVSRTSNRMRLDTYSTTGLDYSRLEFRKSNTDTILSDGAVATSHWLGQIAFYANTGGSWAPRAHIYALGDLSTTANLTMRCDEVTRMQGGSDASVEAINGDRVTLKYGSDSEVYVTDTNLFVDTKIDLVETNLSFTGNDLDVSAVTTPMIIVTPSSPVTWDNVVGVPTQGTTFLVMNAGTATVTVSGAGGNIAGTGTAELKSGQIMWITYYAAAWRTSLTLA